MLRKSHKKLRKGSSSVNIVANYEDEDDSEAVVSYLEIINDFIKANIREEMNQYLGITGSESNKDHQIISNLTPEEGTTQSQTIVAEVSEYKEEEPIAAPSNTVIIKRKKGKHGGQQIKQ